MTAQKLLAPLVVVLILVAGLWFWSGVVAPDYWTTIGFGVAWFVVCSVIFGKFVKTRPELLWWVRGTFLACSVLAVFAFYWTSIRETEVNETIVTGVPASEASAAEVGSVDPLAPQPEPEKKPAAKPAAKQNVVELTGAVQPESHSAAGTARVVKLARGGRVLTLSDGFEIDPGPQVKVYLATDSGGETYKELGGLKGSKGTQQYEIPGDVSLSTYDTVVFWCVPFSVSLASAELMPA